MPARTRPNLMKRTARVYLNDLNTGKCALVLGFLRVCHDVQQYFIDLFWQRRDFKAALADLATVHRACERFSIPTRLSQALAKQAKENVRSRRKVLNRKPMRGHVTTLFYHFVALERFTGTGFDGCVKLIGSGAPRLVLPFKSTRLINRRLASGWEVSKTVRLGREGSACGWS
jgi:hypothetical protein